MTLNVQTVVGLCAAAGFLIVWLVFPARKTTTSSNSDDTASQAASSSSPPPQQDEPKAESARGEETPKGQSSYSDRRPRWCDILLLEPEASPAAIRKAYARLMKGLHPDITGADEHTNAQCSLVQEAYRQAMQDRGARA